jgi:hypothetical protein
MNRFAKFAKSAKSLYYFIYITFKLNLIIEDKGICFKNFSVIFLRLNHCLSSY